MEYVVYMRKWYLTGTNWTTAITLADKFSSMVAARAALEIACEGLPLHMAREAIILEVEE